MYNACTSIHTHSLYVTLLFESWSDNPHTPTPYRFLRHVPVIYVDYPAAASLRQIYGTFNRAMLRLVPNLRTYADPLTEAMVEFYTMSQVSMLLTFNGSAIIMYSIKTLR